ncbi:hypothetical protein G6L37_02200 [Agrobacterium rubi]|nr:hypothetical protein [Agrobacterium rubi]NTF24206.1 hypothetical protein [Agrobacterium rubi]
MTDIAAIIEANDLQFSAIPTDVNPVMAQESDDMNHWFCTVTGNTVAGFDFYVSLGQSYGDEPPTQELALSLIIEDVRAYRECEGYEDFARLLGIDDDDAEGQAQGYAAYEELSKLSSLVEEVLDPAAPAATSSM